MMIMKITEVATITLDAAVIAVVSKQPKKGEKKVLIKKNCFILITINQNNTLSTKKN